MISKEDADKLKAEIKKYSMDNYCMGLLRTIDELTEAPEDPNRIHVGTDRLMVFWDYGRDKNYGNLVNINITSIPAPYYRKQGYHWQHCTPYLSDTVEAVRQLMEEKVIENKDGERLRFQDGLVWYGTHCRDNEYGYTSAAPIDLNWFQQNTWTVIQEGEK